MDLAPKDLARLRRRLLEWYERHRRDLPWRREPTLYRVLLSEFMLQQTRVDQALPYYHRFLAAFPTLRALAEAELGAVMKLWEGLGYYRRAKFLHAAARHLAPIAQPGVEDLDACPGIGPYTKAAIGSIVWGARLAVVDGNVNRVFARLTALAIPPASSAGKKQIQALADRLLAVERSGDWNQAVMELGATVCSPRAPQCLICPLESFCAARKAGQPEAFPIVEAKAPRPHKQIAAAIIRRGDGKILIAQRMSGGLLGDLWEFPGGKQESGEPLAETCAREVKEELGVEVDVGAEVYAIEHGYSHFTITLHVFECVYRRGKPRTLGCQAFQWVAQSELKAFPFPRANQEIIARLSAGKARGVRKGQPGKKRAKRTAK